MEMARSIPGAILALCVAAQAEAGAWARGEGNTFVAFAYTVTAEPGSLGASAFDPHGYLSLMVERGLSQRYTFGLDAGSDDGDGYSLVAYLSRNFGPAEAHNRYAAHFGIGYADVGPTTTPLVYLGASLGRGFQTSWGSGWAALDTAVHYRTGTGGLVVKGDLTLGLNSGDRTKMFVQLQSGRYARSNVYVRAVPTVAYQIAPGRHLELGVSLGVAGDRTVGLKLGTWLEF